MRKKLTLAINKKVILMQSAIQIIFFGNPESNYENSVDKY